MNAGFAVGFEAAELSKAASGTLSNDKVSVAKWAGINL
jgi:hypothetical protein